MFTNVFLIKNGRREHPARGGVEAGKDARRLPAATHISIHHDTD